MKDYKIEAKPIFWHVTLSSGSYSDYNEKHLYFAGNSPEEAWEFLKRYINDTTTETSDYPWGTSNNMAMVWNDKKYINPKYTGDKEDISWESDYRTTQVEIEMLKVIHFQK